MPMTLTQTGVTHTILMNGEHVDDVQGQQASINRACRALHDFLSETTWLGPCDTATITECRGEKRTVIAVIVVEQANWEFLHFKMWNVLTGHANRMKWRAIDGRVLPG